MNSRLGHHKGYCPTGSLPTSLPRSCGPVRWIAQQESRGAEVEIFLLVAIALAAVRAPLITVNNTVLRFLLRPDPRLKNAPVFSAYCNRNVSPRKVCTGSLFKFSWAMDLVIWSHPTHNSMTRDIQNNLCSFDINLTSSFQDITGAKKQAIITTGW